MKNASLSFNKEKQAWRWFGSCVPCDSAFFDILFKTMNNKTITRFGFYDIRNNQSLDKCYQPNRKAQADNTYRGDLDYSGYHKISSVQ